MQKQALGAYREAHANELDQGKLILMMYRGAINFLAKAEESGTVDPVQMGHYVSKAKRVILELMMSLNVEETGETGEMLLNMYQRLFTKLNVAHMRDDVTAIGEVRGSLAELEEAWRTIFESDEYREFRTDRERFRVKHAAH